MGEPLSFLLFQSSTFWNSINKSQILNICLMINTVVLHSKDPQFGPGKMQHIFLLLFY